jgi:nicotinamidase-related amidase
MPANSVNHKSAAALILVDVINHFDFPDAPHLLKNALPMAPRLARLKQRARRAGIPAIYVNDNFGQWRSNASKLLEYCLRPEAPGRQFVEYLRPDDEDYLALKPMHSAFYQSPLEILLRHLGATSLILTGLATNSCIVCTAHDADMRDFKLYVPFDCSAARSKREHEQAIEHVKTMSHANVLRSSALRLEELRKG